MAFHRITLTTVGAGISSTLDLQRWNGSAWVSHTTGIAKSLLQLGYVFEDNTGSTSFKIVDNGACGTEVIFNCEITTTVEPTTTLAPTTTLLPTTTELPTTTAEGTTTVAPTTTNAPNIYYLTDTNLGCGNLVGNTPFYADDIITKFYSDPEMTVVYSPGAGVIGWNETANVNASFAGDIDVSGNITNISGC